MTDSYVCVPCETCRGGKFMMKLGGIYGECNTCQGVGEVRRLKPKEPTFEQLSGALDFFKKYPENPVEHYKEVGISDQDLKSIVNNPLNTAPEKNKEINKSKIKKFKNSK